MVFVQLVGNATKIKELGDFGRGGCITNMLRALLAEVVRREVRSAIASLDVEVVVDDVLAARIQGIEDAIDLIARRLDATQAGVVPADLAARLDRIEEDVRRLRGHVVLRGGRVRGLDPQGPAYGKKVGIFADLVKANLQLHEMSRMTTQDLTGSAPRRAVAGRIFEQAFEGTVAMVRG